ncbi:hypothetical protein RMATCC62417_02038 [Rhizopus microsporus]|nr:hypothetical protein RMATCC62417_02038 [Rhizopus microsporus]
MSTLVNRMLSQKDKLTMINHWLSSKEEEEQQQQQQQQIYYNNTSPRYSIGIPPPPYENVVQQQPPMDRKKYSFSSMIWKRASFSSTVSSEVKIPVTTIDKKQVEHGITLLNIATDMNNNNSQPMAMDLYMMGLDKIMSALPLESDPNAKLALEKKIREIQQVHQLDLNSDMIQEQEEQEDEDKPIRKQLSNLIINAAVLGAVALKKNAVSGVVNYAVDSIQSIDEKHQIRKRTWDLAATGVNKAIQIDRQYEIHQLVSEAVYTGFAAFIKAGMAYAETPGYGQQD